jgi:hypothetical protein
MAEIIIVEYKGRRVQLQNIMEFCGGACDTCDAPIEWKFDLVKYVIGVLDQGKELPTRYSYCPKGCSDGGVEKHSSMKETYRCESCKTVWQILDVGDILLW